MILTVKFGYQKESRDFPEPPTVAQLKADRTLRSVLGYSDNIRVIVSGVEQPDFAVLDGTKQVEIETAANQKA